MLEALDHPALLAVAIFAARVFDVSLGTLRTILVFRGLKYRAAAIGFVEVFVWVIAVTKVIQNLDSWYLALAYAGGFAVGNVVGSYLEGMLAIGTELVRVVSTDRTVDLARHLRTAGYDVIELAGTDRGAPVEVLLVVETRKRVRSLLRTIDEVDPGAFYTVSDVKDTEREHRSRTRRTPLSAIRK